jgi:16S rRNA G966 N2-methylase RsmD
MPTYNPERWKNISTQKGFTILDLETIDEKTFTYDDKLQLQCNNCSIICNPTIGELIKARYANSKCKCQIWKTKQNDTYEDTEDWKVVAKIDHPMASKHRLNKFQSFYMVSRNGEIKNASRDGTSSQVSLSSETYSRVNLRTTAKKGYRSIGIHILVACAFVPVPEEKLSIISELSVDHINRDKHDNRAENLRWATNSEQACNKDVDRTGILWIQGNSVFFDEEDFKKNGIVDQPVEIKHYKNFHERVKIENTIKFPDEIWKRVKIKKEEYFVSSMGRCYYDSLHAASFGHGEGNYLSFQNQKLHRLIARAFLPTEKDIKKLDANHKNGRKYDNRLSNLEWTTKSENVKHGVALGTKAINAAKLDHIPKGTPVRVQQMNQDGKLIQIFPSMAEASNQTGISVRKIKTSLTKYNKTSELSFPKGESYAWMPAPIPETNLPPVSEYKIIQETGPNLSSYLNNGMIRIGKKDFKELQENPDACPAIMKLLEHFDQPIIPVIDKYKCKADLLCLIKKNSQIESGAVTANLRGRYLLNHFMTPITIKGHHLGKPSYVECWYKRELREKLVQRMLEKDSSMNNGTLLGCHGSEHGRLYNFPPNIAKALYNHTNAKRVLDFCAGYGGRLAGFWASNAEEYVGIDPNTEIPYEKLIHFLETETSARKRVTIIRNRAEAVNYENLGKFDTVFTSPPYFNTEIYSDDPAQSCHMYPQIKDWLENFLFATLRKVINVLSPSGTLMINIKDSGKNEIVNPMLEFLRSDSRLVEGTHIKLVQSKRHKNNKCEYIYVWKFPKPVIRFIDE